MTCFWDGILQSLNNHDFNLIGVPNKPNNRQFVQILKNKNTKTLHMKWNGKLISKNEINENVEAINCYNINTMNGGYMCSVSEPFLFLVSYLFKVKIIHRYCGRNMVYEPNCTYRKTLYYASDRGHFWKLK